MGLARGFARLEVAHRHPGHHLFPLAGLIDGAQFLAGLRLGQVEDPHHAVEERQEAGLGGHRAEQALPQRRPGCGRLQPQRQRIEHGGVESILFGHWPTPICIAERILASPAAVRDLTVPSGDPMRLAISDEDNP